MLSAHHIKVPIKHMRARPQFDWFHRLLAAICVVNVYDPFMSTGDFIADSIAIVTDLIKLSNRLLCL